MTLIGRDGRPTVDPTLIRDIALTPEENVVTNAAIRESVQEFPPPINTGAWFTTARPGAILFPFGTKARDKQLRDIYRNEYNNVVQGTIAALTKKVITTPWIIDGDQKTMFKIPGPTGKSMTIRAVDHYQIIFQSAQFGMGWEFFLSQFLEDFFTQDFGAILEKAGLGEPTGPIDGPIMSLAHLDAGRCYVTGNPYYPIMYWSLISGSLHRMHASRVVRFVDQPSPAEEFFGIGMCAMSRVIAIAERQMLMNRYIQGQVDDKPKPGIMAIQGMTDKQIKAAQAEYLRDQQNNERPFWGKTMWIASVNMDNPIKIEEHSFAAPPPNFDWEKYNSLDVNAVALAFNTDRQEIWELQGRGLGSGAQSQILHQKSEGKMFGYILQNLERMFNRSVLIPSFEFQFKYKDPSQEQLQSQINLSHAQTVQALASTGAMSVQQQQKYLASVSEDFKDALTNDAGQIVAPDAAVETEAQDVQLEDATPAAEAPAPAPDQSAAPQPPAKPQPQPVPRQKPAAPATKAFSVTAANFERQFVGAFSRALGGRMPRSQFEGLMLGFLSSEGRKAYADGLRSGGGTGDLSDEDEARVQNWLVDQIDYIDGIADELYDEGANPDAAHDRATLWVNKSLGDMFEAGRLAANPGRMYRFDGDDGVESCNTCKRLKGQVHSLEDWHKNQLVPKIYTATFDCGGWKCQHKLVPTDEPESGDF